MLESDRGSRQTELTSKGNLVNSCSVKRKYVRSENAFINVVNRLLISGQWNEMSGRGVGANTYNELLNMRHATNWQNRPLRQLY